MPLLSTKEAQIPSAARSGSTQAPLSFTQAARQAELDADSSDYGGTDELLSPRELMSTQPSKLMGPPPLPERDPFEDDDEMLDDAFNDARDHVQISTQHDAGQGGYVDFSSFTHNESFDDDWTMAELDDGVLDAPTETGARNATCNDKQPFHEESRDSAAVDLGIRPQHCKRTIATDDNVDASSSSKKAKLDALGADIIQPEAVYPDPTLTPMFAIDDLVGGSLGGAPAPGKHEKQPSSPDSLGKWFAEEFGTEGFNYVGRIG